MKKNSKSIYKEALEKIDVEFDAWDIAEHFELLELVEQALQQAEKQGKLLKLYEKLAEHRLTVIYYLLEEISDLAFFDIVRDSIEDIKYEAKYYGHEDNQIVEEIEKLKELIK